MNLTTSTNPSKTTVLRFLGVFYSQLELNQIEPLSPEEQTTIIGHLGITQNPGESPAAAWVRVMHRENSLPYIPDYIHPDIIFHILKKDISIQYLGINGKFQN